MSPSSRPVARFLAGVVLATSCSEEKDVVAFLEAEPEAAPLQTEEPGYTLTPDGAVERVSIGFVYRNPRREKLYHPICRPNGGDPGLAIILQKQVDGRWIEVWGPALPGCLSEPIEIPSLATYRDTLDVWLHPQDTAYHPQFNPLVEVDGTYRLVWLDLLRTYDPDQYPFGVEVPEADRVSNPFTLRRE